MLRSRKLASGGLAHSMGNPMSHSYLRSLVFALCGALAFAACKPKPGDKCSGAGLPTCSDPATALICLNGTVTALPCRGPKACTSTTSQVSCDNALALAGDSCDQPGDVACSVDHKAALECQNGKFAVAETCKGVRACQVEGNDISCDDDVADLGDPCHTEATYACSTDKLTALKCVNKKFQVLNTCRGKDGCRVFELPEEKKTNFVCDDTLAQENDVCDTDGEEACSMDKTEILHCKSSRFVKDHACTGGCSFDEKGEKFVCASASASPPSPAKTTASVATAAKPKTATTTATSKTAPKPATKPATKVAVAKKTH